MGLISPRATRRSILLILRPSSVAACGTFINNGSSFPVAHESAPALLVDIIITYILIRMGGNKFPFYFDGSRRHLHAFDFGVFLLKDYKPFSCLSSVTLGSVTFHGFLYLSNGSLDFFWSEVIGWLRNRR